MLTKFYWAYLLFTLSCMSAFAADGKKDVRAGRTSEKITIDGKLSEKAWQVADKAESFTQLSPNPGNASRQRSKVSILYDDHNVYIGAFLFDTAADSILKQLTPRDNFEYDNTDAFGVVFDTYNDHQNGFAFVVTAAGVQADAKVKFDGYDYTWNAAWYSKALITDSGWCVEMKIPYSALRFPKKDIQLWGANFFRNLRRVREKSYWSKITPGTSNTLNSAGLIKDIASIQSPLRLALLPYISAYAENYDGKNANTINGGLDIKYGINESFTLDMTLVPDFGQTLYDNRVLNLSPIEVRYDERRYFFTEGVDLFNKNDLFYSRRVGGTPINNSKVTDQLKNNEIISENPANTQLYNATKISGRTKGNLGIGLFNAISAPTYAKVYDTTTRTTREIQTAPLSNYSVLVLEQALKHNSYISFINTNVSRKENSYNANVSALLMRFVSKSNKYAVNTSGDLSSIYGTASAYTGHRFFVQAAKISGNYTWYINTQQISDKFNPNDLGYLARNNVAYYNYNQSYNIYKPFWIVNQANNNIIISYNRILNPDAFQSCSISGSHGVTLKNFLSLGVNWSTQPITSNDYFEPRTPGRYYVYPSYFSYGGYFSSDYRKKFALDGSAYHTAYGSKYRETIELFLSPRYRFSDQFSMVYSISSTHAYRDVGYVNKVNDSIFLGTRNVHTLENALYAAYIFTSKMSLQVDARHYWSVANYLKYDYLENNGQLTYTGYTTNHNINFNTFNIFANLIWQFKPGSEVRVVYQNSIYSRSSSLPNNFADNLQQTFKYPQSNSISVKVIYFLDYQDLKGMLNKNSKT